jgi:hypothetical protein
LIEALISLDEQSEAAAVQRCVVERVLADHARDTRA